MINDGARILASRCERLQGILKRGVHWQFRAGRPRCLGHHRAHFDHPSPIDILDEVRDVIVCRSQNNVLRIPLLNGFTITQNSNLITNPQSLIQIMGDENDCLVQFFLQIEQNILHVGPDQRIKRRKGLVHQQNLSIRCQRPGKADTLLHATRQLRRIMIFKTAEADALNPALGTLRRLTLGDALNG